MRMLQINIVFVQIHLQKNNPDGFQDVLLCLDVLTAYAELSFCESGALSN